VAYRCSYSQKKKGTVSHGSKSLSCWKWME
jgi:hypothetical protein